MNKFLTFIEILIGIAVINYSAQAVIHKQEIHSLDPSERASLRYHLENLFNEIDLLIKNQKIDRADVKKQERDLNALKVYERIPFLSNIRGLQKNLSQSSHEARIQIIQFKHLDHSKKCFWAGDPNLDGPKDIFLNACPKRNILRSIKLKSPPDRVFTDDPEFHFSQEQLIEVIHFKLIVASRSQEAIYQWIRGWPTQQLRLTELDSKDESKSIRKLKNHQWEIRAHAFRFRDTKFPTLQPRPPKDLLPKWARVNPKSFSESEPLLWSFVTRIENLAPKAGPFYKNREQLLLNDARMNFFLSKVTQP